MMQSWTLVWGAADWLWIAAPLALFLLLLLAWGYWGGSATIGVRVVAASLKTLGILILALCLLEPLFSSTRARPGANLFIVLADNSQSMTLQDRDAKQTRAQQLKALAAKPSTWLGRLGEDFDLRQYAFDTQVRPMTDLEDLTYDGGASNLTASLDRLAGRYQGRPLAGMLLFTDGNSTDADALERLLAQGGKLPPIYPVLLGEENPSSDINLQRIAQTQTNFEDAPVTLTAYITTSGFKGKNVVAELLDESNKSIKKETVRVEQEAEPLAVRFQVKPEKPGLSFYRVSVSAEASSLLSTDPAGAHEATQANNNRIVAVDRGTGPYRVLYVAGRPNWEYKFLQRALQTDTQVQLVGMLRIAKREPKFNFLGRTGEQSNPLFRGFGNQDKDGVEQYDQPVLKIISDRDEEELRGGFPKTAAELFAFHAIILDDLESEFFSQDQMLMVKEFVGQRGGGLLMLGGEESFKNGKFDRTPIGDLLPVYADEVPSIPPDAQFRLSLTREGMLEPWVRLRSEEDSERHRLEAMPGFQTLNQVRGIKPGATILAQAQVEGAGIVPALVQQRFGKGRVGAMLIGDLWRWGMRRAPDAENDLDKAWRQTIRWLVAEVPRRVEVTIAPRREGDDAGSALTIGVQARDPSYAPLDNAAITVRVTAPDGKTLDLVPESSNRQAGLYEATYIPHQSGAYRAAVVAKGSDGNEVAQVQTGWTSDPAADEFRELKPNRALLEQIAKRTGGQTVSASNLSGFVATLPNLHAEVTEPYIRPMWHQGWVFLLAIACLSAEWGLRRWRGMP